MRLIINGVAYNQLPRKFLYRNVGKYIGSRREELRCSKRDLSRALKVSIKEIERYERGDKEAPGTVKPRLVFLLRLSRQKLYEAFRKDAEDFINEGLNGYFGELHKIYGQRPTSGEVKNLYATRDEITDP